MRAFLLVLLCCFVSPGLWSGQQPFHQEQQHVPAHTRRSHALVPREAFDVLAHIVHTGTSPKGYVGGRTWENRERRLPPGGIYREFDIHPKIRGKNRGPERIVFDERTRLAWYTPDHYRTFIPMERRR